MFDIRKSTKAYFDTKEHFIVVRKGTVYLRVVGEEGNYDVMTATASEDDGSFSAFSDQQAMNATALLVSGQLDTPPSLKTDFHNRPYVKICNCEFLSDAYRAAIVFFVNLDAAEAVPARAEG
jgi:hypothetical protein